MILGLVSLLSLVFSFIYSGFEVAYFSFRTSHFVKGKYKKFLEHPDKVLLCILTGNNFFNVIIAISLTFLFLKYLSLERAIFAASVVSTSLIIILGEFIPKTLARRYPIFFLSNLTKFIFWSSILLYPLIYPLTRVYSLLPTRNQALYPNILRRIALKSREFHEKQPSLLLNIAESYITSLSKSIKEISSTKFSKLPYNIKFKNSFELVKRGIDYVIVQGEQSGEILGIVNFSSIQEWDEDETLEDHMETFEFVYGELDLYSLLESLKYREDFGLFLVVDADGNIIGVFDPALYLTNLVIETVENKQKNAL